MLTPMNRLRKKRARAAAWVLAGALASCTTAQAPRPTPAPVQDPLPEQDPPGPRLDYVNPPEMHSNPTFSQAICVEGPHRTLYIGGQNAVDGEGRIVGVGDIAAQSAQVARNFKAVLDAAQAGPESIVRWTIHVVDGESLSRAMIAFQGELASPAKPATVTVLFVPKLAHPDFLIEIDAVAVLPPSDA